MTTRCAFSKHYLKWLASKTSYGTNSHIQPRHVLSARLMHLGEHFKRGMLNEIDLQTPVPLAGRKYLASSESPGFPKYLSGPREDFPLLIKALNGQQASMKLWAMRSREIIDEAYQRYNNDHLPVAILFRGLPNSSKNDFSEWVNNLGFNPFSYVGGVAVRHEIALNVSDGANDDKVISIEPHNDMSYSPKYPKMFAISCLKKPLWGGETAICENRDLYAKLDRSFVQKCVEKDIRYWRCLHDKNSTKNIYQSWQQSFLSEDRSKVDEYLHANGYEYAWNNDSLFYWTNLPPYRAHANSAEPVWFNQITMHHCSYFKNAPMFMHVNLEDNEYPCNTTYGDGEEIEQYDLDNHRRCTWESAVGFQWQNGDILFLDQLLVQHARLGFVGDRKVCVSILDY